MTNEQKIKQALDDFQVFTNTVQGLKKSEIPDVAYHMYKKIEVLKKELYD